LGGQGIGKTGAEIGAIIQCSFGVGEELPQRVARALKREEIIQDNRRHGAKQNVPDGPGGQFAHRQRNGKGRIDNQRAREDFRAGRILVGDA